MKEIRKNITQRLLSLLLALLLAIGGGSPLLAAGLTEAVGPQESVGPVGQTGTTEPTGPTETVGVQETQDVAATDIAATNGTTGPESENNNSAATDTSIDVDVANDAAVDNTADLKLVTGQNTINQNSVAGNLTTGNIDGSVNVINLENSVLAEDSSAGSQTFGGGKGNLWLTPSTERVLLSNGTTGPGSSNTNNVGNNNIIQILENNNANADNTINIEADTGANTIKENTKIGDILTGNINLSVNLINLLNIINPDLSLSVDIWSILGNFEGDIIIDNALTGPDSSNTNTTEKTTDVNVDIENNADINNDFTFDVSTGQNEVEANTQIGNITTGASRVESSITNAANLLTPTIYLVNVFGEWDGVIEGVDPNQVIINTMGNTLTGPDSNNTNANDSNTEVDVDVENNADVNNRVNIKANTGRNKIDRNTSVGDLLTGNINISANAVNVLNSLSNQAGKFTIGIINIFGNWKGKIKTKPSGEDGTGGGNEGGSGDDNPVTPDTGSTTDTDATEDDIEVSVFSEPVDQAEYTEAPKELGEISDAPRVTRAPVSAAGAKLALGKGGSQSVEGTTPISRAADYAPGILGATESGTTKRRNPLGFLPYLAAGFLGIVLP
ncbi:MAG: hypothetical protein AAB360_02415 [Patescibacteria group bacterium]